MREGLEVCQGGLVEAVSRQSSKGASKKEEGFHSIQILSYLMSPQMCVGVEKQNSFFFYALGCSGKVLLLTRKVTRSRKHAGQPRLHLIPNIRVKSKKIYSVIRFPDIRISVFAWIQLLSFNNIKRMFDLCPISSVN